MGQSWLGQALRRNFGSRSHHRWWRRRMRETRSKGRITRLEKWKAKGLHERWAYRLQATSIFYQSPLLEILSIMQVSMWIYVQLVMKKSSTLFWSLWPLEGATLILGLLYREYIRICTLKYRIKAPHVIKVPQPQICFAVLLVVLYWRTI